MSVQSGARFRDNDTFDATIDAAAERLGISATAIEKDYWVSEVLRSLVAGFPTDFVFKGGTSLSKGYRLVERFSEDVDVLVLPGDRGRGATDKLMKAMADNAALFVGGEARPVGGAETGRHRSSDIVYPTARPATALLRTAVLLEMGIRGGDQPHELRSIGSLLGDVLSQAGTEVEAFDDLRPFDVPVLHPVRTLLEKLVLVDGLAVQIAADPDTTIPARTGRHFYDLYQLLGADIVTERLGNRDETAVVVADIAAVSQRWFPQHERAEGRPAGGFAASTAFDTATGANAQFRHSYETTMPELYFGTTPLPDWEQLCQRVHEHADLL